MRKAGWLANRPLAGSHVSTESLKEAARDIRDLGVSKAVVIHFERGAVCAHRDGECYEQGAVCLPDDMIQGTVGAGDAFAAGFVYGLHENLGPADCMHYAVRCAAACLTDPTPSGGMRPLGECLNWAEKFGYHEFE